MAGARVGVDVVERTSVSRLNDETLISRPPGACLLRAARAARSPPQKGTALRRKLVVPILVALLAVAAIGTITSLQEREGQSQRAELKLATLQLELAKLQEAPYKAN